MAAEVVSGWCWQQELGEQYPLTLFLESWKDFPCAEVAIAACPALPCLSKVLWSNRMLGVLLLYLEEAVSQIKVPAV